MMDLSLQNVNSAISRAFGITIAPPVQTGPTEIRLGFALLFLLLTRSWFDRARLRFRVDEPLCS